MSSNPFLITPEALAGRLGERDLTIVDASWYLPADGRNPRAEYEAAHVPGAVFFDQDAASDPASALPHTLPSPERFAAFAGRLGISDRDTIVVYDGKGLFSAPRVWWMLRVFGARNVLVLDGGLPAWVATGLATETGSRATTPKVFAATFDADAVVSFAEMRDIVGAGSAQIADARSAARFEGSVAEPRAGVQPGHMPGARSLPITLLADDGRLRSPAELRGAFEAAGIDPHAPIVTSCGSGVTAAVLNLALLSLGNTDTRLYDGSWTEWGSASDTPIETGPAAAKPERA